MIDLTSLPIRRTHGHYRLPRNNVVMLSCMDLRLMSELTMFMDRDNLTNRYDHLIFAGASLGVIHERPDKPGVRPWRDTFFDHLAVALQLHQPHDVYIVEHRNCGAYIKLFGPAFDFNEEKPADMKKERQVHAKCAHQLTEEIGRWYPTWLAAQPAAERSRYADHLRVLSFLMDLRGNVELLEPKAPTNRRRTAAKRP
jgi:hypothetical protein